MKRRVLLQSAAAAAATAAIGRSVAPLRAAGLRQRARLGTAAWPAPGEWDRLKAATGGRLMPVEPAFAGCTSADACATLFTDLKNPYYINETPNVTQTLGWADAWQTQPSAYAVAAESVADVAAAVSFASRHDLRLVVRGGAHSYQGTSNAPESLMIWTRAMNQIVMHDTFVPAGCNAAPVPAVSLGPGNIWGRAYDAVTTQHGRYVQGGGCVTVGVAGLVSGGGFGSFSKRFGSAAGSLLEAEIVTADGAIRIANACQNPRLFWALKGGGGSTFGVITRLTVRTHDLPETFGAAFGTLKAASDGAFARLIERFVAFYADALHDPHWGEQAAFTSNNELVLNIVFQGLDQGAARAVWQPFLDWAAAAPHDYTWTQKFFAGAVPARHWWDPAFIEKNYASAIVLDSRPGASPGNFWWTGNTGECGQFMQGYESLWIPASLLAPAQRSRLSGALFAASRHFYTALHFNKGLSGAPPDAIAAALDTATNPAVAGAFALAIIADSQDGAYPGVPGHEPNLVAARANATSIHAAMEELRAVVPNGGAYVSEASYFDRHWQRMYWGPNYDRLTAIKREVDPNGLFVVHHGVGSEEWSPDGFTYLGPSAD